METIHISISGVINIFIKQILPLIAHFITGALGVIGG